jgi:hypothetical protein
LDDLFSVVLIRRQDDHKVNGETALKHEGTLSSSASPVF